MANHSLPTLTSTYTNFVSELDGRLDDLAVGMDPAVTTVTNPPTGSIRWNSADKKWEKWSGTAWNELSANYAISLQGPSTVSANSTGDALRITQTGTGNALVVEDEASDGSAFIIDSTGIILRGLSTARTNIAGGSAALQTEGPNTADSAISVVRRNNAGAVYIGRQNGTNNGDNTSVGSPQVIGALNFIGADGTNLIRAASVTCSTDNTVSSGSMPGALVLSTTPSGSATPVERLRIDSSGAVGIGTSTLTGYSLRVNDTTTSIGGAATKIITSSQGQLQSDVTSGFGFHTALTTAAGSYTVASISNYYANGVSVGSGSTVTNQYGYRVHSSLNTATNNYGFYGEVAAAAGRWNFYAAGTAANYFAGETTINSGLTIGRTAVTSPAASDGNVFSGTYTPALTNSAGISQSTAYICQYMRVGNVVTVSGVLGVTTTGTGSQTVGISLPIASTFTGIIQAGGSGTFYGTTFRGTAAAIYADSANARATFNFNSPSAASGQSATFTFTYRIL